MSKIDQLLDLLVTVVVVGPLGVGVTDGVGPLGVGVTDGVGPLGVGTLGVGVTEGVGPLGVGVTEGVGPLGVGVPDGVGPLGVGVPDGVGALGVGVTDGVGPLGVGVGGVTDGIAEETLGVLAIVVVGSVVETKTFIWYIKLFTFNIVLCRNQTYTGNFKFQDKHQKIPKE